MIQLRIPGPTPIPPSVLKAMTQEIINHRSREFQKLHSQVESKLKEVFQTKNDILILTASGTGAMEATIVNLFSPENKVLIVSIGEFGDRYIKIAKIFGLKVVELKFPFGQTVETEKLKNSLTDNQDIKAVIVTHNETSTGVTNDLKTIAEIVKRKGCLLIVDAVSSLGAIDLPVDKWNIDIAITASQKAWMAPPGLAMISISKEAWLFNKKSSLPKFYWDFQLAKKYLDRNETPFTPAVMNFFALNKGLDLILDEGLKKVFLRHRFLGDYVRKRIFEMGLDLLPSKIACASNTVTAVKVPAGININNLLQELKDRHGVVLAEGQGDLKDKIFRVAHLGFVNSKDMKLVCDAIEKVLKRLK